MNPRIGDMIWVPAETYLHAGALAFTKLNTPRMLLVVGFSSEAHYDIIYEGQKWSVAKENAYHTQASEEKNDNQISRSL